MGCVPIVRQPERNGNDAAQCSTGGRHYRRPRRDATRNACRLLPGPREYLLADRGSQSEAHTVPRSTPHWLAGRLRRRSAGAMRAVTVIPGGLVVFGSVSANLARAAHHAPGVAAAAQAAGRPRDLRAARPRSADHRQGARPAAHPGGVEAGQLDHMDRVGRALLGIEVLRPHQERAARDPRHICRGRRAGWRRRLRRGRLRHEAHAPHARFRMDRAQGRVRPSPRRTSAAR
jgi:hypothetical protein